MNKHFYHLFANGDDAKDFIINEEEFKAAFNRVAVCAVLSNVTILAASIEDTHPHILMLAEKDNAERYKNIYRTLSLMYISRHRESSQGVVLNIETCEINDESYLMNAASYVIAQATKDGKPVMPYDYLYGTGALYFRSPGSITPWDHDYHGNLYTQHRLGDLSQKQQWRICNTKNPMPANWIVVNGFIHPKSFVDVDTFQRIFKTHNCFRAFLASSKSKDEIVRNTMSAVRGLTLDDLEARRLYQEKCKELFGTTNTRYLTTEQRLKLASVMREQFTISFRQLSTLTKIPESEIRKYIR